jgi:hypothetical protein
MHEGNFGGPCKPEHGLSRASQSAIGLDHGGVVYTDEVIDLEIGTRISFDYDHATGEQVAINIKEIFDEHHHH